MCNLWYLLFKVVVFKKVCLVEVEEFLVEIMKILNVKCEELVEVEGKLVNLKLMFVEMIDKK